MKIAKLLLFALLPLFVCSVAGAEGWKLGADMNLTLTQNAFSNNWAGGESGSLSWQFQSNSSAEKQLKSWVINNNTLKLLFGQTHNQDPDTEQWLSPIKSADLIDFESTMRFTLGKFVDPVFALRVITQFLDQSDPAKDRIVNPVDITETIGIAKVFIKEERQEWMARVGAGFRQIISRDVLNPVTLSRETLTEYLAGFEFVNDYKVSTEDEKLSYISKLTVFESVFYSEADKLKNTIQEDDWKYPDVNFENTLNVKLTKYLIMNFYIQVLYDRQIDLAGRFMETMSLGLTYKLL
jgi:hypothetical protein